MKFKTILACAVLGLVIFNGRLNAAVESDVVGYTTVEINKEWTLMGVNFVDLENATTDKIPVFSLMSGDFGVGDQIQIPRTNGADVAGWNEKLGKWCTISRGKVTDNEATFTVSAGQGFWLQSASANTTNPKTVQFAGQVYNGDAISVLLGQQYTIFSPLCPSDLEINSDLLTWSNLTQNDQLQIPTANGADVAGWNATVGKWCTISRGKVTSTPSSISIKNGTAVWVVSTSADAMVSFSSPLSK